MGIGIFNDLELFIMLLFFECNIWLFYFENGEYVEGNGDDEKVD